MIIFEMKSLKEVIGDNITRIIKDSPYTSRDIAKRLNVTEVTIHRWKTGENPPDVANLEALAKLLKVDPADFYKTSSNVLTVYGNVPLKKYLIIPDDIVEELCHFPDDSNVWANIRRAIELEKTVQSLPKGEQG